MGETPLVRAAKSLSVDIIRHVIRKGASVNVRDRIGRTALLYVGEGGHLEAALLLLQHGAEVNVNTIRCPPGVPQTRGSQTRMQLLLFAAGQRGQGTPHDDVTRGRDLRLMSLSRTAVRQHMLRADPHGNLLYRVLRLEIPEILQHFLLYNVLSIMAQNPH